MNEKEFAVKIRSIGGELYLVGGFVRDTLLGKNPQDKDYLICGVEEPAFLKAFPSAKRVGGKFPVFHISVEGKLSEVSLARREKKISQGYNGFAVEYNASVTLEEDLARRDITINSMAYNVLTKEITDPFGGLEDLKDKIIQATTGHFREDPLRALRAARFAAQFDFTVCPKTLEAMTACADEIKELSKSKIMSEFEKAKACGCEEGYLNILRDAKLLYIINKKLSAK